VSAFFAPLLSWLLSPIGIVVFAALDSTLVFWLPVGLDLAMVVVGARHPHLFWLYALIGAGGSVIGAYTSFRVGMFVGESGLTRFVPERKLNRMKRRVQQTGATTLAALDLLPPPFPFTLFIVVAGALDVDRKRFFVTLAVVRFVRFGIEAGLGAMYGARLATEVGSEILTDIAGVIVVAASVLTVFSAIRLILRARHRTA